VTSKGKVHGVSGLLQVRKRDFTMKGGEIGHSPSMPGRLPVAKDPVCSPSISFLLSPAIKRALSTSTASALNILDKAQP